MMLEESTESLVIMSETRSGTPPAHAEKTGQSHTTNRWLHHACPVYSQYKF